MVARFRGRLRGLSGEAVALALFDPNVTVNIKAKMSKAFREIDSNEEEYYTKANHPTREKVEKRMKKKGARTRILILTSTWTVTKSSIVMKTWIATKWASKNMFVQYQFKA